MLPAERLDHQWLLADVLTPQMKQTRLFTLYLLAGMVVVCVACRQIREGRTAERRATELAMQLNELPSPPQTSAIAIGSFHKFGLASAQGRYRTALLDLHVWRFYDQALRQRGWRRHEQKSGSPLYCKSGVEGLVEFAPPDSRQAWSYVVALRWTINPSPCH